MSPVALIRRVSVIAVSSLLLLGSPASALAQSSKEAKTVANKSTTAPVDKAQEVSVSAPPRLLAQHPQVPKRQRLTS